MAKPDWTQLKHKAVFISGHPKAGTSLLLNLLDSQPQLVVFPEETLFFRDVLPLLRAAPKEEWFEIAEKHLIEFFRWNSEQPVASQTGFESHDYGSISYTQVHETLESMWPQVEVEGDVLSAAVLAFGEVAGQLNEQTRRWVEKTPLTEYHADEIFTRWPAARVLHIVRDPRDNFASYKRKHIDWSEQHFARKWRRSTQAGLSSSKRYGQDRYLMVRYQDLVRNTGEVMEQICAFLGIDFEEAVLQPTKMGVGWKANTMFDQAFEQVSSAPVGRWKTLLSDREVGVIEAIAAKQMKACDYALARRGGPAAYLYGLYWRWRQNFFFSLGSGRDEKGLK